MTYLPKKYTIKNPYIYFDKKQNRKRVKYWGADNLIKHTTYARWYYQHIEGFIEDKNIEVHHINLNPLDDRFDNLILLSKSEHTDYHNRFGNLECIVK